MVWKFSGKLRSRVLGLSRSDGWDFNYMMDYHGFWRGFIILFGVLPVVVGATVGVLWAWRNGKRGTRLVPSAIAGAAALGLCVFVGAVLLFRA